MNLWWSDFTCHHDPRLSALKSKLYDFRGEILIRIVLNSKMVFNIVQYRWKISASAKLLGIHQCKIGNHWPMRLSLLLGIRFLNLLCQHVIYVRTLALIIIKIIPYSLKYYLLCISSWNEIYYYHILNCNVILSFQTCINY